MLHVACTRMCSHYFGMDVDCHKSCELRPLYYFYAELMYLYSLYITDPLESSELNALIVFLEVVLEVVLEVLGRLLVAFLSLGGEGREGALVRLGSFLQCVLYAAVWGCCSCRLPFVLVNRIHWSVGPPCLPRLTSTFPFGRHGRL